jgi:anti-sigma factor RsiW
MSDPISEQEVHAYIDGELPPERAAAVEAAMDADPALAARIRDFRADKQALFTAYASLTLAPIPPSLQRAARNGPARRLPRRPVRYLVFAAAVALAACLVLIVLPRTPGGTPVDQAMAARDNGRAPSRELIGNDGATVAAANQAMSDMLGNAMRVPDLTRAGFALVSTEIYGTSQSDAVQLRYQDADRRLFTVYLRPSAGPDAFEVTQRGPVRICVWQNADLTAVMTGAMPTPELFRLASMTYASLGL